MVSSSVPVEPTSTNLLSILVYFGMVWYRIAVRYGMAWCPWYGMAHIVWYDMIKSYYIATIGQIIYLLNCLPLCFVNRKASRYISVSCSPNDTKLNNPKDRHVPGHSLAVYVQLSFSDACLLWHISVNPINHHQKRETHKIDIASGLLVCMAITRL